MRRDGKSSEGMDRRRFLAAGALAGSCLVPRRIAGAAAEGAADVPEGNPLAYHEPARDVPIVERADVVVCGAGPAGVAAAIAAARCGATVRLLEVNGCLGGVWTAGLLSWILDATNKPGLMPQIIGRLAKADAVYHFGGALGYDVEPMKWLLEQMCLEAGVRIQLHTRVVAAAVDEGGRLRLAVTESKSGRQAWSGKVFVDATGDGDLAAQAGCNFDYGEKDSGRAQPMSMIALLVGIDPDTARPYLHGLAEKHGESDPKTRFLEELRRAGVEPSYSRPTLFYLGKGIYCLAANHQYGPSPMDAGQITQATLEARAEVYRMVEALRSLGGCWTNVQLAATAEHIGVRDGRRIRGLYEVTIDDLVAGRTHEDAVCRVTFPIDIHSPDPHKDKGIVRAPVRSKPYDIPYRALVARDVKGLLAAGRCISGDFVAHSSYRVTGNSVATGQAAGVAAALAAQNNCLPAEVPWVEIRRGLEGLDLEAAEKAKS